MDEEPITLTLIRKPTLFGRSAFYLAMGYLLLVSTLAISLFWADDLPIPTLLAFGPRWPVAIPIPIFLLLALITRSWRILIVVILSTVVIAWPLMGLIIHPGNWGATPSPNPTGFRVLTWNCGGVLAGPHFTHTIETLKPDIVILQEQLDYKVTDFPHGWSLSQQVSGLLTASRYPIRFSGGTIGHADFGRPGSCRRDILDTPHGQLTVFNCHLPTVRTGLEEAISTKLRNLKELRSIIADRNRASAAARQWVGEPAGMVLVAGDFNTPTDSKIYKQHWSEFQNAFNVAGNGYGGTKMTKWHRIRIDHILYKSPMRCADAFVGPDLGSDHLPMIADLRFESDVK